MTPDNAETLGRQDEAYAYRAFISYSHRDKQLAQWLQAEHGMQVGVTTLWRTLARLKLSLKKSHSTPPSRPARMS